MLINYQLHVKKVFLRSSTQLFSTTTMALQIPNTGKSVDIGLFLFFKLKIAFNFSSSASSPSLAVSRS